MKRKRILTEEELYEIKAQEYERGLKDAQPKVTEEFIKKWADVIHQADTGLFGIKGELKLVRQMLKEAGVGVA